MVRPFQPTSLPGVNPDIFKQMRETTLLCTGEWVRHLPCGKDEQWVGMHFQHIPQEAQLNPEYEKYKAEVTLWGLADHFECVPLRFDEGHSGKPKAGSQFEIQGYMYNVMGAPINHRGYMRVFLCRADKCAEPRPDFCDDVAALTPC